MSNRKKIKRPKLVIHEPAFPRVRIRERTDEEIDEIIRRKQQQAKPKIAMYSVLGGQDDEQ